MVSLGDVQEAACQRFPGILLDRCASGAA